MTRWTVDSATSRLVRGGTPTFLLADTVWAALSAPTDQEWDDWLTLRRRQGFNAVAISVARIEHDASTGGRPAFALNPDGTPDLDRIDDGYFADARRRLRTTVDAGITPILVLLWNNYVPGTWGAELTPHLVMTDEQSRRWVDRCIREFADLDPIWVISGDDHLTSRAAIERYTEAARQVRAAVPDGLITVHTGPIARLDDADAEAMDLDFYTYQSGHDAGWDERAQTLAAYHLASTRPRPVLNLEPAYEGHATGGGAARFRAHDVRRAIWSGIVAGAGAGVGYGAHGVWQWHRRGAEFSGEWFSGTPYPASIALRFDGAWDAGFAQRLVERHGLFSLTPQPDLLVDDASGAVAGSTRDGGVVAVFAAEPFPLRLRLDGEYDAVCYDLGARSVDDVRPVATQDGVRIPQPEFLSDALYVFTRRVA